MAADSSLLKLSDGRRAPKRRRHRIGARKRDAGLPTKPSRRPKAPAESAPLTREQLAVHAVLLGAGLDVRIVRPTDVDALLEVLR